MLGLMSFLLCPTAVNFLSYVHLLWTIIENQGYASLIIILLNIICKRKTGEKSYVVGIKTIFEALINHI